MNDSNVKNKIALTSLLRLKQQDLYKHSLEHFLPELKNNINEFNIARLLQEKIRFLNKEEEYILALQWVIYYSTFRNAKINHKSSQTRHSNALSLSNWYIANWHEDDGDRQTMLSNLVFASADHKIKAAAITLDYYEEFKKMINLKNEEI